MKRLTENARKNKIQNLVITQLLEEGIVRLVLPSGMVIEIGITQEDNEGKLKKVEDYCWLIASQDKRSVSMDSYNLGLRYRTELDKITIEDEIEDENGVQIKVIDVV